MLKKMIFGLMTVCLLAFAWSACSEKKAPQEANQVVDLEELLEPTGDNPLEKMVSLLEKSVSYLKDKHIKTEEDVQDVRTAIITVYFNSELLEEENDEWAQSLTEEENAKLTEMVSSIQSKLENLGEDMLKETERLKKEAEEKGLKFELEESKTDEHQSE